MTDTQTLVEQFLKNGNKIKTCEPDHKFPKKIPAKYAGFANEYKSR